jgi:AmmeMemoRadiSam system protein B
MSTQYDIYINKFLDTTCNESILDKNKISNSSDSSESSNFSDSSSSPPITPPIINTNDFSLSYIDNKNKYKYLKNIHKKNTDTYINVNKTKNFNYNYNYNHNYKKDDITKDFPELIYIPPYNLLCNTSLLYNKNETDLSLLIDTYITKIFDISKTHLKSNVNPDTIKAILVPYSTLNESGLCCASSYYQLYNRTNPIKRVILLCTNTSETNQFISTSFTYINSYKSNTYSSTTSLKFDTIIIDKLKPYIEINNENIQNELSFFSNLPFIEYIAPNSLIIPILISNKIYLDNSNIDKINNIIYILKKLLYNDDTILICTSNFSNIEFPNNNQYDIYTHCNIKKKDNVILQFIYDTVNGIKSRSSKIDDILFMQNTPTNSTMAMYVFSNLLAQYSGITRPSSSSSSSISSNDSGISVNYNKISNTLYSRITSYYNTLINKNIDIFKFQPSQLFNFNTSVNSNSNSYVGIIFTSQPTIGYNYNRVLENSISEYEKLSLINFVKEQLYFNTNSMNNSMNNIIKISNIPINSPIFKTHLGLFIIFYKNNKIRACIGTSDTNNDEYTIEKYIKKFILEISIKETKCRDLIFKPIVFDEINDLTFNINILYHMKSINIDKYYSNYFKFGCDGLLFKSIVNNENDKDKYTNTTTNTNTNTTNFKYSLTSISHYFDNNINTKEKLLIDLYNNMNTMNSINNKTINTFKLFFNEGILINSN